MPTPGATTMSGRRGAAVPSAVPTRTSTTTVLACAVTTVLALYFGHEVFQPLAIAILLSFALAPVIKRLQRWKVPKTPAIVGVVLLSSILVAGTAALVSLQLVDLAQKMPEYEQNLLAKIKSLGEANAESGLAKRLIALGGDLEKAIVAASDGTPGSPGADPKPVAVEIHSKASPFQILSDYGGPILKPLTTAGIAVIFTIFILLQREDLRDRLIRLTGSGDLQRTTAAIDDGVGRLSRFLLAQVLLNSVFGVMVGLVLWAIGLPNPLLWGIIAGLMRFVPFIGSMIAAGLPLVVALAVSPGWTVPALTLASFVVLELVAGNVVEPWLYGSSTGLSPLSVLVAAIFWTVIWGMVGLLLAMPLTVCLMVLGRHVPQLAFLDVLLGNRPALSPETRLYQRMLANDSSEAVDIAEEAAEGKPLPQLYESLLIPALRLAEADRRAGILPLETRNAIAEVTGDIVAALSDHTDPVPSPDAAGGASQASGTAALLRRKGSVLCLPAHSQIDAAAAGLLAHLLRREGLVIAETEAATAAPLVRRMENLPHEGVGLVCLIGMTLNHTQTARLIRRVQGHFGSGTRIVVAILGGDNGDPAAPDGNGFPLATTLGDAVRMVREDAMRPVSPALAGD
ncbi:AI-2E family transporter [Azospirillum agricola]|uniref:AI-2E family transporter n=1 Tax=Azospirillum agricola TaxID=1720247 RepID=UPI000A0F207A|nr:AI-2E family transporter [Azospirillum agricola]SMH37919.1 Predicted PurR-regulated permease PerM [Azospirillum lipoferum]